MSVTAAALRRRGYDAHTRCGGAELIGVEVRAVHVIGWRYPDGHWTFADQPARISADVDGDTGGLRWSFLHHRGEVGAPSFGSVDAIAEWITGELPAPEHVTCRLERHPDFIDAESGPIPLDWFDAWEAEK
jgi:hypothetical protein